MFRRTFQQFLVQKKLRMNDFISHQGNTISLGNKNRSVPTSEYQRADFLRHNDGPKPTDHKYGTLTRPRQMYSPSKRPATAIENPRASENLQYQHTVEAKKQTLAKCRSEEMLRRSHRTGFNVITGEIVGSGPKEQRLHTRHIRDGLGPESHSRGMQVMRDSSSRYFTPHFSGEAHHKRQERLVTEGLSHPKMAGVINIGKGEAPSYGLEDQFSRSQYIQHKAPLKGLVERRVAGAYSPRKQNANENPSANTNVRGKWTTGVHIGNLG